MITGSIHDALHEAAAHIHPPPDGLLRARRRGRRLRRRATFVRTALPLALVVALVAASSSSGGPQQVDTVDDTDVPVTTTSMPRPSVSASTSTSTPRPRTSTTTTTAVSVPRAPEAAPPPDDPFVPVLESGARIAFFRKDTVHTMRTDGSDHRPLTGAGVTPYAWADHRTLILPGVGAGSLEALDVETGSRRTIIEEANGQILSADVSPDGSRLVYSTRDTDTVHVDGRPWDHIYVVNADGSGRTELPVSGEHPSWSPDGTRILLGECTDTSGSYLCTVRPDGTGVQGLDTPMYLWPRFSPDGQWIAGYDENTKLGIVRVDGTGARHVVDGISGRYFPAWTPDGGRLVYGAGRGLFSLAVDGSGEVQLTDGPSDGHAVIPWR